MSLFHRRGAPQCFFCHSLVNNAKDHFNFRCSSCGCWNRYDKHGEIMSWEPAMQDESLNRRAFSKRGSPSKARLPTMYGKGPFCHTCQTNQMLMVNLLSNYLPDPDAPEYEQRVAMLPEYRESLHARYPPVCNDCLPAVEEELQTKDKMARVNALGSWLKQTKGKQRTRRVSGPTATVEKESVKMLAWRIRGCLWVISYIAVVGSYIARLTHYGSGISFICRSSLLPILTILSLLWTFWDPTYASLHRARREGRDVRLHGKQKYIALQMVAWLSRVLTTSMISITWHRPHLDYLHMSETPNTFSVRLYFTICLLVEISIFITSFFVLQLQQPPAIRLLDTTTLSRSGTPASIGAESRATSPLSPPPVAEPDLFATLSLSSNPVVTKPPIFGVPSVHGTSAPTPIPEADEMDWTPTNGGPPRPPLKQSEDDASFWLRPQRFFAPEAPTGLESLFERTRLAGDDVTMNDVSGQESTRSGRVWRNRRVVCAIAVLVPVIVAVLLSVWFPWRGSTPSNSVASSDTGHRPHATPTYEYDMPSSSSNIVDSIPGDPDSL